MKGEREKNLFKNTIIISIGTICTKLITFFLLPLYTGVLSTEEYGIVDLLNTLAILVIPIVTFQVEHAVYRNLIENRNNDNEKNRIITNGIVSVCYQIFMFLALFITLSLFIKNQYKFYLLIIIIFNIFSSLFMQIARGLGDNKKYSISGFLNALTTIIFSVLFLVVVKLNVTGLLIGIMAGHFASMIYLFISLKISKYFRYKLFNWTTTKQLWKYSLPLVPNAISWWIFGASDRVIVSIILGLSMNGILSAAAKFSAMYVTIYNIFNVSWTESISLHINDNDISSYFSKMFDIIIKLFIAMAITLISLMPFIYPIMINKDYQYGINIMPILLLGSLFNIVVGLISAIYIAKKNTKAIANTSIFSAATNIIIHLVLIKYIGLYAAAVSTFASYFIMAMYRIFDVNKKYFKININKKVVMISILMFLFVISLFYINNIYLNIMSIIISVIFSIVLNLSSIKEFYILISSRIKKRRMI